MDSASIIHFLYVLVYEPLHIWTVRVGSTKTDAEGNQFNEILPKLSTNSVILRLKNCAYPTAHLHNYLTFILSFQSSVVPTKYASFSETNLISDDLNQFSPTSPSAGARKSASVMVGKL